MTPSFSDAACAVRIDGLSKRFGGAPVLDGVSLDIRAGEFVALLGSSGAGKTTLFRCLTRLIRPDEGSILLNGAHLHDIEGRSLVRARRDIGLIFQQFNLVRRLSAYGNVLAGRLGHVPTWRGVLRGFGRSDRQLALACLDRVGLLAQAEQRADSLSGGQQQRVAIARVLAQQSRFILADEPVASLDPASAHTVMDMLRDIARENGIAVLCSLHQVDLAEAYADRVVGLRAGRVVVDKAARAMTEADRVRIYHKEDQPMPAGEGAAGPEFGRLAIS
jgi:phosphonate transport system ATP-binding protein